MKFVMDTDHISVIQHDQGTEFATLSRRIAQETFEELALTIVSFHEQVLGCHDYINRSRQPAGIVRGYAMLDRVLQTFSTAPVLPFDQAASELFDQLSGRRLRVGTMDLRIASIAISRGLILLTRNVSDFGKVPGLVTDDWTI
jgi:tRNA(fMet)-specific endonuclease VapC